MAVIYLEPANFPGGYAGAYAAAESSNRSLTASPLALGTIGKDAAGNEYTLVRAGAIIAASEPVRFNIGLGDVRAASAAQQLIAGVAVEAFASLAYGWILSRGSAVCKVVGATAINSLLVTGAVAATLELADATDFAGARGIVQLTAEAGGLATVRLY